MQPSWKVFDDVLTRGDATSLATMLHLSKATISNWTMPSVAEGGEGQLNPFDRVVTIIETLRTNRNPRSEQLLHWLNERLGYLPAVRRITPEQITDEAIGRACAEFGDFMTAHGEETASRRVTLAGVRRIRKEIAESVAAQLAIDNAWKEYEAELECEAMAGTPPSKPMPIRNRGAQ